MPFLKCLLRNFFAVWFAVEFWCYFDDTATSHNAEVTQVFHQNWFCYVFWNPIHTACATTRVHNAYVCMKTHGIIIVFRVRMCPHPFKMYGHMQSHIDYCCSYCRRLPGSGLPASTCVHRAVWFCALVPTTRPLAASIPRCISADRMPASRKPCNTVVMLQ